jgi:GTP-binding protein
VRDIISSSTPVNEELPLVAIVGRPNVGKSTLFNRFLRQRKAIVESLPGVTRDRLYATAAWAGRPFAVVDTGGLDWDTTTPIQTQTTRQAEVAIAEADVVVYVVDATVGVTVGDEAVAGVLRKSRKPLVVVANKVDDPGRELQATDFYRLGLAAEIVPVSAFHGTGVGDLLDLIVSFFPPRPGLGALATDCEADEEELDDRVASADEPRAEESSPAAPIRVAVVGRPNVGKSSLVNAFLGEERVIVTDEPGTTRDAIDVPFHRDGMDYILVDTAGLRKRARVKEAVERYSIIRTVKAVSRADVVLLLLDAAQPLTEQDKRVAGFATDSGRALVLVVNKWDLVTKDDKTYLTYEALLRRELHFADWAPIVFASAKTGQNQNRLLETVGKVSGNHRRRVPTPEANRVFRDALGMNPPPAEGRRRLRVGYVTQASAAPPTFVFFVNTPELVTPSYRRYLEGRARQAWDFEGTPVRLSFRSKGPAFGRGSLTAHRATGRPSRRRG